MSQKSRNLLAGAYDLQIHAGPDIVPREVDAFQLASRAQDAGMAGILLKDHVTITADRAAILKKLFPKIKIYGAIALNYPIGGLNPEAVTAAIRHGVKQVYMPTYAAAHDVIQNKGIKPVFKNLFPRHDQIGIRIVDNRNRLLPAVEDIIDILSGSDVILGTGHISPLESLILISRATQKGIKKILVTHAMGRSVAMSVVDQKRAVAMGAMIEQSYLGCTPLVCRDPDATIRMLLDQIRQIGCENVILSSDLGQKENICPVAGMQEFAEKLLGFGLSETQLEMMIKSNPRLLVEN